MGNKIMIADDDPMNLLLLGGLLENNGYEVVKEDSGVGLLSRLNKESCDLILLDVMMDDLDGYETCRRIKEKWADLPVIHVTALTESAKLKESFESGAVDYIKKPIDETELIARVKNAIKMKEAENEIKRLYGSLKEELSVASKIQTYILPRKFLVSDGVVISSFYTPSDDVGGDLFDIIKLDEDRFFVYIADISGHGVQAALLMTAVKSTIHMLVENMIFEENDLSKFFNQLNTTLCDNMFHQNYMTMIAGVLDIKKQTYEFLNAGHPALLCYDSTRQKTLVCDSKGALPVGWISDAQYLKKDQGVLKLDSGMTIVFYTDGITESVNANDDQLDVEGFAEIIENVEHEDLCLLLPYYLKAAISEAGYDLSHDDSTILGLQILPELENRILIDTKVFYDYMSASLDENVTILKMVSSLCEHCAAKVLEWTGDEALSAKVDIVLAELLNNVFVHAYKKKNKPVVVEMLCDENVYLRILDEGPEWKPDRRRNVVEIDVDDLNSFAESGRGISIVQSIASSFLRERYETTNETIIEIPKGDIHATQSEYCNAVNE